MVSCVLEEWSCPGWLTNPLDSDKKNQLKDSFGCSPRADHGPESVKIYRLTGGEMATVCRGVYLPNHAERREVLIVIRQGTILAPETSEAIYNAPRQDQGAFSFWNEKP